MSTVATCQSDISCVAVEVQMLIDAHA